MRRYSVLLAAFLVLILCAVPRLRALTDDEKRQQFLDSQRDGSSADASPTPHHKKKVAEAEATPRHKKSPTPEPEVTPHHKHVAASTDEETPVPKRKHSPSPSPSPSPRKHATHTDEDATPTPKPTETPMPEATPDETPRKAVHREERNEQGAGSKETPIPKATPTPKDTPIAEPKVTPAQREERIDRVATPQMASPVVIPAVTPFPSPPPRAIPAPTPPPTGAQVNITKEGLSDEGGLVPPPETPAPRKHWWQVFSSAPEPQYHYLTKAIRDAIDRAPVARQRWRFIVVHNSGTRQGNAKIFDYYHLHVRKMPNGLAYHFVIGNGTSSGNGQIEIGNRWIKQLQGGHVHSDYLNNIALGICLVGDFNRDLPTKEQLASLEELIRYLRKRVGPIDRKPAIVKAHREINPPQWPTDCPGDRFPYHWLHQTFD